MDRELWVREAATFDEEPDHGVRDPETRAAWRALLLEALPPMPARVADLGCGTGTPSRLLTDEGYVVDGLDYSPEMIARARAKVPESTLVVGNAAAPPLPGRTYDVVLSRHVLWALPDPVRAVAAWVDLLAPDGRLVLVEGRWHTGAGLGSAETERIVRATREEARTTLLEDPAYWGGPVDDERFLLVSRR